MSKRILLYPISFILLGILSYYIGYFLEVEPLVSALLSISGLMYVALIGMILDELYQRDLDKLVEELLKDAKMIRIEL